MQQQPPSAFNLPLNAITTEQIQKYLEENHNLIMAILEYQKLGKLQECAQYQVVLQKNLMYLAAIADAQPPTPESSNLIQQQPGGGSGGGALKPPFQLNSNHNEDQQQQQLGIRAGAHGGMFGMQSAFRSEMVYGGDGNIYMLS